MQGLLHPFFDSARLAASNTYYDAGQDAIYHSLTWSDGTRGAWLVTNESTYALEETPSGPARCVAVATNLRPPGTDWLDDTANCAGQSRVQGREASWWKTRVEPEPGKPPPTTWFWFDQDDQPWRTMFAEPSYGYGVLGLFSFDVFQGFEAVEETPIAAALAACKGAPGSPVTIASAADLYRHDHEASTAREDGTAPPEGIPGLTFQCDVQHLPQFEPSFQMTTLMSSVAYQYDPLPTRVYYQYDDSVQSMRTRMFNSGDADIDGSAINADALLIGGKGYLVQPGQCQEVLPGIPVPNWQAVDRCTCRARITGDPAWNQYQDQLVIQCALEDHRMFWTWYTPEGRPIVFMETGAPVGEGTSLALADYYGFEVPTSVPAGTFDVPESCAAPTSAPTRSYARVFGHAGMLASSGDARCNDCHEPLVHGETAD